MHSDPDSNAEVVGDSLGTAKGEGIDSGDHREVVCWTPTYGEPVKVEQFVREFTGNTKNKEWRYDYDSIISFDLLGLPFGTQIRLGNPSTKWRPLKVVLRISFRSGTFPLSRVLGFGIVHCIVV